MIDISEIVATWPVDANGWSVSPGVPWCAYGSRIRCGDRSSIGDYSSLGDYSTLGNGSRIGDHSRIGDYSSIGNGSRIGNYSSIGDYSRIGDYSSIGDHGRIGAGVSEAHDIGFADGYRKCVCVVEGVAYVGAGCRWFTLAEAIRHWSGKPDRVLTLALLESAKALAAIKGWRQS